MARIAGSPDTHPAAPFGAPCSFSPGGQSPSGPAPSQTRRRIQSIASEGRASEGQKCASRWCKTTHGDRGAMAAADMVHDLEARDFHIADNGVAQQITHFDLGGDPISMVILIETSSRIAPPFWPGGVQNRHSLHAKP